MRKLGKFEILDKIGQGAMGVVYKARDPLIGRIVALKTITTGLAESPDLLNRFYGEAQSAGRLQHPNIVTIFELGSEGDTPFIAMEFLTGESLEKLIARRPKMPLSQKLGYIVRVCQALEYAHRQNPSVVHRDIKPANVMVTSDGTVKVVDFGIARLGEGSHSQSSGMLLGTLKYMSPQQFRGGSADARSDIWSTGIMLYELLCYHRPFDAENPGALVTSIMVDRHRSISEAAPGTPAEIEAIVDRMLCKELDGRYQNMEEVLMELEPVWHQVQQAAVANLVADGRRLFEMRDLARAEDIVREALQLDTSNTQAKSLLEKINAELRRIESAHEATTRVKNGQDLLSKGQLEEAKTEAEAALRLDSTFQPARELLAQVQAATERARLLANALRASKQRLAEGALTEAELQLDKVLEMDPSNSAAQGLLQQIRNEQTRRERQVRLAEALRRARTLWTNLQYEECISVLLDAQKEFPGESEIARLLSTAREDHAEHQRQSLLGEARKLLSAQRFEETLKALDGLLERFPSDATARNLRTLALQGQEQEKREQRLNENLKNLRAMVEKENYQEVIESGQKILQEFPHEVEIAELIRFARNEQIQNEQKRHLDDWIRRIQQSVRDERFTAAIQDAQEALKEFPQDVELLILSERAKKKQGDKERENLLRQRLQEVEKRIERQEFAEAIDLARETLVTVGTHPGLASLLHRAEMEFEQRKRKQEQDEALEKARTLLDAGALGDATLVLENAVETKLFAKSDPRFAPLLDEIDAKKQQRQVEEALKELRSLLADGRYSEVIGKGKAMLRELPQDVELQELVDFAQEEISREQQRQKEKEREQEIQSFLEAGRFLDAEEAALRAANEYPSRTSFRRLLEEARRRKREEDEREKLRQQIEDKKEEQRRKEEQERQVEEVRTVIERGNLAEAMQLLHRAIAGKVFERSDVLAKQLETEIEERKREKEQKTADRERHLSEIQRFIGEDKIEEASQALTRALDERVLDGNEARTLALKEGLEDKKKLLQFKKDEQEKKQKARELEQKRREAREALGRAEFSSALRIAKEGQAEFGSDTELGELARRAEAALAKNQIERRNHDELLQRIAEHIKGGNISAADLLLNSSLSNGTLQKTDPQVIALAEQLKELAEEEKKKRNELQQAKAKLLDLIKKRRFAEAISAGQSSLDRYGFHEDIADLVNQAEVANVKEEVFQKRRQAELQTVRGLLSDGNAREAKQVCDDAIRQGILRQQDPDVKGLLKRIEADFKKQDRERAATEQAAIAEVQEAEPARNLALRVSLAIGVVVLLLGGWYGVHRLIPKPSSSPPPVEEGAEWLKQAKDSLAADPHQFENARDLLNQIVQSSKAKPQLKQEASELLPNVNSQIQMEGDLLGRAKQDLALRDCKNALPLFEQVVKVNGDHVSEARQGLAKAQDSSNCEVDPKAILQESLVEADQAFRKEDWQHAKSTYESVSKNSAATPAQLELARTRSRTADAMMAKERDIKARNEESERLSKSEAELWDKAVAAEVDAGNDPAKLEAVKGLFKEVSDYGSKHKSLADKEITKIDSELAAINKERECGQKWSTLTTDFNNLKDSRDADKLGELKKRLDGFGATPCPQVEKARNLANQVGEIIGGFHPPPPPPGNVGAGGGVTQPRSVLSKQDEEAIKRLIDTELTEAFHQRSVDQIQALWPAPYFDKASKQFWKEVFGGSKEFTRRFKVENFHPFNSDDVEVSGNYEGENVKRNGPPETLNGDFSIRVMRDHGNWKIKNISF
jgi:eukaryotic-like serine/threonine-protein kinase